MSKPRDFDKAVCRAAGQARLQRAESLVKRTARVILLAKISECTANGFVTKRSGGKQGITQFGARPGECINGIDDSWPIVVDQGVALLTFGYEPFGCESHSQHRKAGAQQRDTADRKNQKMNAAG